MQKRSARPHTVLLGILNDILDFSKVEAGKLKMEHIVFRLEDVMNNISNIISMKSFDKGIEFAIILDHDVPTCLKGDPLRLNQVLLNLINNAVKFTEKGEVFVHIKLSSQADDDVTLLFEVHDSGIGMTEEQIGQLFQPFSQADVSTTRRYGGTGLGLAISKTIVEKMNGTLSVESQPNIGSVFSFTGIFKKVEEYTERIRAIPEIMKGLKVLVADDNSAARLVLFEYLELFSYDVDLVASGKEAVSQINDSYDLVILDWKMPGMDGIETWKKIKEKLKDKVPKAIVVSAYDKDEIEDMCYSLGVEDVLLKPITQSTLFNSIMKIFGEKNIPLNLGDEAAEAVRDLEFIRGASLLVVEDNEINQQVVQETLVNEGFFVDLAENGKVALEMIQKNPYDAVLMDLQMPVLDGYQTTIQIRDNISKTLPVIALSAGRHERYPAQGAGCRHE